MPVDLKALVAQIAESGRARTPLSRLSFLRQIATEEELAELFTDLLVKTAEGKHADQWADLVQFIEDWEDQTLARRQHLPGGCGDPLDSAGQAGQPRCGSPS